jgi:hypothetical protein
MSGQRTLLALVGCLLYMVFPILTFIDQQHTLSFVLASLVMPLYFLLKLLLEPKANHELATPTQNTSPLKAQLLYEQTQDLEHPNEHGLEIPSI